MASNHPPESVLLAAAQPAVVRVSAWGLGPRVLVLGALFAIEVVPVSFYIGGRTIEQWLVAFAVVLATLLYVKARPLMRDISTRLRTVPFGWAWLGGHFASLLALIWLRNLPAGTGSPELVHILLIPPGLLAVAFGVFAFVPWKVCGELIRGTKEILVYALGVGGAAALLVNVSRSFWQPATEWTFYVVRGMLRLVTPNVVADAPTATIGTSSFQVIIAPYCSGLEGVGMMLVFSLGWLWFFRRECRFPQALLLVPAGVVTIWLSNSLRIAALILVGSAGFPNVAVGGFHSQAGWIAFNAVALGFALAATRLPWVAVLAPERGRAEAPARNPSAAYLMPFLMILASGMISAAASGTFEWLYPLRFLAAAATLWFFRREYRSLDWRFGPVSVAIGAVVFGIWLALDRLTGTHAGNGIAGGLAHWPAAARAGWLAFRTIAAVTTVPIAEELAFRGFLIRRLMSRDFESLDPRTFSSVAVLVSSVAFGLLHGDHWLAGIVAGLLYAAAFLFRGRIGDAVAAHGTTNAMLAAFVMLRGKWYLW